MQDSRAYAGQNDRAEQNERVGQNGLTDRNGQSGQGRLTEGKLPASFTGCVEHGRALGRTIGMPTANITPADIPEWLINGVYLSRVTIWYDAEPAGTAGMCTSRSDGAAGMCGKAAEPAGARQRREYRAISNIGRKPTVQENGPVNIETFIYDFDEDIYGREITVTLLEFLRPERRFASFQELAGQLEKDILAGRQTGD